MVFPNWYQFSASVHWIVQLHTMYINQKYTTNTMLLKAYLINWKFPYLPENRQLGTTNSHIGQDTWVEFRVESFFHTRLWKKNNTNKLSMQWICSWSCVILWLLIDALLFFKAASSSIAMSKMLNKISFFLNKILEWNLLVI